MATLTLSTGEVLDGPAREITLLARKIEHHLRGGQLMPIPDAYLAGWKDLDFGGSNARFRRRFAARPDVDELRLEAWEAGWDDLLNSRPIYHALSCCEDDHAACETLG